VRHTDGLVSGNQSSGVATPAAQKHGHPAVIGLGKTESPQFGRDFYPKATHAGELRDDLLRDFAGAVNFLGVHMFAQIWFEAGEKLIALQALLRALCGEGVDCGEIKISHKKAAGETAAEGFAGAFGKLERSALPRGHFGCVNRGFKRVRRVRHKRTPYFWL
jgi:hypothetical protein